MVRTPSTMAPLGMKAPPFSLPDPNGTIHTLADFDARPALLVAFLCNHCPFVKHIANGLAEFGRTYGEKGLATVAISSNDIVQYADDGPEEMAREAALRGYTFPYLFDETQEVAKAYGAACTPDFFLFDGDRTLVYRGQFDGSRPGNDVPVDGSDLRRAVDAVLRGEAPSGVQHPSIGCNIKWKPGNEPEYFSV